MKKISGILNKVLSKYVIAISVIAIIAILLVYFFANFRQGVRLVGEKKANGVSVNNIKIDQVDLQKKLDQAKTFFEYKNQDVSKMSSLEKDVMENLTDENLINQYAKKNGIKVTDSEVLRRYDLIVKGYNKNNNIASGDTAFLLKIKEMYGIDKNIYLDQVRGEILKEKVQMKVKIPIKDWLLAQRSK